MVSYSDTGTTSMMGEGGLEPEAEEAVVLPLTKRLRRE